MSNRMYLATVTFTNARTKPRVIAVEAAGRSEARKAARSKVADLHPEWEIAHVTARTEASTEGPVKVAAKVTKPTRKASKPRKGPKPVPPARPTGAGSRGGCAFKAYAWAKAIESGEPVRSRPFMAAYRAARQDTAAGIITILTGQKVKVEALAAA